MKKYELKITNIEYGIATILAENEDQATEKVYELVNNGMVEWHSSEVSDVIAVEITV